MQALGSARFALALAPVPPMERNPPLRQPPFTQPPYTQPSFTQPPYTQPSTYNTRPPQTQPPYGAVSSGGSGFATPFGPPFPSTNFGPFGSLGVNNAVSSTVVDGWQTFYRTVI